LENELEDFYRPNSHKVHPTVTFSNRKRGVISQPVMIRSLKKRLAKMCLDFATGKIHHIMGKKEARFEEKKARKALISAIKAGPSHAKVTHGLIEEILSKGWPDRTVPASIHDLIREAARVTGYTRLPKELYQGEDLDVVSKEPEKENVEADGGGRSRGILIS